jgi:hypothetical protein
MATPSPRYTAISFNTGDAAVATLDRVTIVYRTALPFYRGDAVDALFKENV